MAALDTFIDDRVAAGQGWFSRDDALASGIALSTLSPALTRAVAKGKPASPRHGFYLIVRPEQRAAGAADPAEWIDPLMKHQGLGYRVSLLRAAAHHGSSHQAAMIFQVVAPQPAARSDAGCASPAVYLPRARGLCRLQRSLARRGDQDAGWLRRGGWH